MKQYPKSNEDVFDIERWNTKYVKHLSSGYGSIDDLAVLTKNFYREEHLHRFGVIVKEIWLQQQLFVSGARRKKRTGNGIHTDMSFSRFSKILVGINYRVITSDFTFTPVSTYLSDFFPDFLHSNPFEEPEKYQYPYKHVTLDHLAFVYQVDERLELLKEAEKRSMTYAEFVNYATNWAVCYNDDVAKGKKYEMIGGNRHWQHIRNRSLDMFWENDKLKFDVKK